MEKYPDDKEMIIAIPIDFKPNNIAIFEPQFKKVEPLFQGDKEFYINTPSFEEHIAEAEKEMDDDAESIIYIHTTIFIAKCKYSRI